MISSDGNKKSQEEQLEELLSAHVDALFANVEDFDPQFAKFELLPTQRAEAAELMTLASHLRETLVPAQPSDEFVYRLKSELVGAQPMTLAVRWRKLPAQYQLAAKLGGLTLTAGIALLAARRALDLVNTGQRRKEPESDSGLSLNTIS